ncbi:nucleotidyl transferase AbiEii/AbiGii toxin family protein [Haliscomenobacter hydrossis]|nr:nucleotidyl transferase AbiEii/AbiGii toxin family protein [Haliscomenobacter hydrossis]
MLQTRTVEPGTLGLLKELMAMEPLQQFYLVGGTSLALQMGHRISIDLDLFTAEPFDKQALLDLLTAQFSEFMLESEGASMLITNINQIKVDFVKMGYPILFPPIEIEGVRMLDIRDIAPMKLKAIAQRGSKKDFYDIYFLLKEIALPEMLRLFSEKFQQQEIFHIIKSLTYFEDAEQYPNPNVFDKKTSWEMVKSRIFEVVQQLT